jgi:hypothetical protein
MYQSASQAVNSIPITLNYYWAGKNVVTME